LVMFRSSITGCMVLGPAQFVRPPPKPGRFAGRATVST
jgi:hypothetical protein